MMPGSRLEEPDGGFSLIELLVVLIIVGVLAAIAIPIFQHQLGRARDASTKADVSTLGKEVATYFVDGRGTLGLDFATLPGSVVVTDYAAYATTIKLTNGTAAPAAGASSHLGDPTAWCVALTNPRGAVGEYRYSAANGLEEGTC